MKQSVEYLPRPQPVTSRATPCSALRAPGMALVLDSLVLGLGEKPQQPGWFSVSQHWGKVCWRAGLTGDRHGAERQLCCHISKERV